MKVRLMRDFYDHKNTLWKKSADSADLRDMPEDYIGKLPSSAKIIEGPEGAGAAAPSAPVDLKVIDPGLAGADELDRALSRAEANQAALQSRLEQVKEPARVRKTEAKED